MYSLMMIFKTEYNNYYDLREKGLKRKPTRSWRVDGVL